MEKFVRFSGIAAPLEMINVDTDMIIPKQFLKTIKRTGLGKHLFEEMRYKADGKDNFDFILNRMPYRKATILLAGANFGCGSSREHAVWALKDFGIKCIIAPSFSDIFFNNCQKNGLLPIKMGELDVQHFMAVSQSHRGEFTIDLAINRVIMPNGAPIPFQYDEFQKRCLLEGLDDIGLTMEKAADIDTFEAQQKKDQPWLYEERAAA